jgi:hypothetical protein
MTKRNDKKQPRTARLQVKKEILRNLTNDDLTNANGGLMAGPQPPPGPCPRSRWPA